VCFAATQLARHRVAYPGEEASLRGPEGRIWTNDFSKSSLGDRTKNSAAAARGGQEIEYIFY